MHARTMVVDGVWATIGSTNFDNRSFALDEELNLIVYNASSARQLEEAFEQDLKYSKQITYAEWNSRGIGARIYELFAFPVKEYPGQRIPMMCACAERRTKVPMGSFLFSEIL